MSTNSAPARCIACRASPRPRFRLGNGRLLRHCPRCGLSWWDFPDFNPSVFYDQEYFQSPHAARGYDDYAALEPGLRRTARARLRRIERLWSPSDKGAGAGRLLDIGCGTGVFMDEARRAGWQVDGIEVSAYAAARAAARGLAVRCAAVETVDLPARFYDCVTMWDVLEHLRDPERALNVAAGALRKGGVLALSTGDISSLCARLCGVRWHLFNLPEHLFFFTPDSLVRLLRACGCRVVRLVREVNWVPLGYLRERLAKTLGLGCAIRTGADSRRGTAPSRWSRLIVPATLFDVVGVYARRC
jgi:SAM-dependent methyltransferase